MKQTTDRLGFVTPVKRPGAQAPRCAACFRPSALMLAIGLGVIAAAVVGAEETTVHGVDAGHSLEHRMTVLAFQIGVILFAGYFGTRL
ncbi:MAG TPA: hypothetical protein VJ932_06725, partial [Alkalispirochaeta sp.]|nr:hypothetical protein [Alkalispirochaeta sp.]